MSLEFEFANPDSPIRKAMEQVFGTVFPQEEAEPVTIFMIHGSPMTNELSNWEPRLKLALQTYAPDEPLVLVGLIRPDQVGLGESPAFQELMRRPRVRYVDVIGNFMPGILQAVSEVRAK